MKKIAIFFVFSIIGIVLISGCLDGTENKPHEETAYNETINDYSMPVFETGKKPDSTEGCLKEIKNESSGKEGHSYIIYNYSTPGYEIDQEQACTAWRRLKFSDDAKFVTIERSYSVTVFVQSFNENPSHLSSAEWIAVATSIPVKNEDVKIAIFRLDYQTLDFKRSYYFSYPGGKNLSLQQSAFFMEEEMKKEPKGGNFVDENLMALYGGNYISSYPGSFSGGTIIFNKYAGKVIFHATTVQGGRSSGMAINIPGRLITPGEDTNGTSLFNVETRIEAINSPAYRGTTTIARLSFTVPDHVPNGSDILLEYRKDMVHTDGSLETEPAGFLIIPEKKRLALERGNGRLVAYSNFTVKTGNASVEGDYLITSTLRYRGWVVGKNVFSFKIGKGGKKTEGRSMTESSLNIGYSADNPPPLNLTEKEELTEVVLRDPYLKEKMYKLIAVTSEFLALENYSGFFAVVTVDVGDPDYPGEIIRYIVDREEKKIFGSSSTPRKALEYFRGEAFDEAKGNFTKKWYAENFPGLWHDPDMNISTETLVIDQSILDSSNRVIEKHNLIYNTYSVPFKFQVFTNINVTEVAISNLPFGGRNIDYASIPIEEKKETYQAMGWQGEKHASIDGNRIAKVLLEQNASQVRTLTVSESWNMGEGYVLTANSIDAKASTPQAWFTLGKDGNKLYDLVMTPRRLWIYTPENDTMPLFITYFNKISAGSYTDEVDFKYTWLRSRNTTEIKPGGIFGIMEITSVDNGRIELRNRAPIELAPSATINLMGNLNFKVGSSNTSLSFHPYRVTDPNVE